MVPSFLAVTGMVNVTTSHRTVNDNITSFYGSSCANKSKGALNTPDHQEGKHNDHQDGTHRFLGSPLGSDGVGARAVLIICGRYAGACTGADCMLIICGLYADYMQVRALELLYALGALDEDGRLTQPTGALMAELPLEPALA
eukprot:4671782-Pyramimonas_sp.AAC.1